MIKRTSALLALAIPTLTWAAPTSPSNLHFTNVTSHSITLHWNDNSTSERGFKLFRDGKLIDFVSPSTTSYVDRDLSSDRQYKYEIKASDDFGFKVTGDISKPSHVSIFIDSDNNSESGYTKDGIVGADILLQNQTLYKRNTQDSSKWGWEKIGTNWHTVSNNHMFMGFDEQALAGQQLDENANIIAYSYAHEWQSKSDMQLTTRMTTDSPNQNLKQVHFTQTPHALKNPLKGFMVWPNDTTSSLKYVSLFKALVPWGDIEETKSDGVNKIRTYSEDNMFNHRWDKYAKRNYSVEDKNIKVNPIVNLWFNNQDNEEENRKKIDAYFPKDMQISDHDNQTDLFVERINNLVPKLAQAWDNDPRIGFIYMGITGKWGEQFYKIEGEYQPLIMTPKVITALGDSFTQHFKNKKVLIRHPKYFDKTYLDAHNHSYRGFTYPNSYKFGMFWDAFAWSHEMNDGLLDTDEVIKNSRIWVDQPILGEVAFAANYENIYDYQDYSKDLSWLKRNEITIHDNLTQEAPLDYIKDYIRSVHCTALTWISLYNEYDEEEAKAADALQSAMGYRFVLQDASFTENLQAGEDLKVSFSVKNIGSAPFYYNWPLEIALLDRETKQVIWSDRFKDVDIRNWQAGDDWDFDNNLYKKAAKTYNVDESFTLPANIKEGEYIVTLSILDPFSMRPAVKFAMTNYYNGGRTALGMVGIGATPHTSLPAFDDLQSDELNYKN